MEFRQKLKLLQKFTYWKFYYALVGTIISYLPVCNFLYCFFVTTEIIGDKVVQKVVESIGYNGAK